MIHFGKKAISNLTIFTLLDQILLNFTTLYQFLLDIKEMNQILLKMIAIK